jgi:hypothetical protein
LQDTYKIKSWGSTGFPSICFTSRATDWIPNYVSALKSVERTEV